MHSDTRLDIVQTTAMVCQSIFTARVGLPATRTRYDALGRVIARVDQLGNTATTTYSPDGRTVSVLNPNTSTRVTVRSAGGDTLSVTGTAVTPEFRSYGILADGTRWTKTVQGETADSPRFTKHYENMLGQTVREERSGFQGAVIATTHSYDTCGRLVSTATDYEPTIEYTYDVFGNKTTMMTYRNESLGPNSGDVTTWLYDEAPNTMTNKVYADGKGPAYFYTPDGRLSRRILARGTTPIPSTPTAHRPSRFPMTALAARLKPAMPPALRHSFTIPSVPSPTKLWPALPEQTQLKDIGMNMAEPSATDSTVPGKPSSFTILKPRASQL